MGSRDKLAKCQVAPGGWSQLRESRTRSHVQRYSSTGADTVYSFAGADAVFTEGSGVTCSTTGTEAVAAKGAAAGTSAKFTVWVAAVVVDVRSLEV